MVSKLFISGFPLEISEMELAQLIAPHGDIDTLKIVRDRMTRICKGYAFVEMQTAEGTSAAIAALNGMALGERLLTVKLAEEEKPAAVPSRYTNVSPIRAADRPTALPSSRAKRPRKAW